MLIWGTFGQDVEGRWLEGSWKQWVCPGCFSTDQYVKVFKRLINPSIAVPMAETGAILCPP